MLCFAEHRHPRGAVSVRRLVGGPEQTSSDNPRQLELFMFEYEGSRSEFLKLLAEFGEEPAFIARARAPVLALEALLRACDAKREEMLEWPKYLLAVLAHRIGRDWVRIAPLLAVPESVARLDALHASMPTNKSVQTNWLESDSTALLRFLKSAERFNCHWRIYIEGLDLEPVNLPRRAFNQFYVLEKDCAFGSEGIAEGFDPLGMIDSDYLYERFPVLALPAACVSG